MKKIITILILGLAVFSEAKAGTYWVGTGTGSLTVDGSTYTYPAGSVIIVKSGTSYGTITFQNLNNVTIMNDSAGAVITDGFGTNNYAGINMSNCNHIDITWNPADSLTVPYAFVSRNNNYRPTGINGQNTYDTIQHCQWFNIGDYVVYASSSTYTWNGTDATVQGRSLSFLYDQFDSCSATVFEFTGSVTGSAITNLQRYLEIAYCNFRFCDGGDLCFGGAIDRYNIHDNTFVQINQTNDDDNGLFHIIGNGNFYRNRGDSIQGHFLRMWTLSFGTTPEVDSNWDNICLYTRKYSMFEYQSTVGENVVNDTVSPYTTYVNVIITNNTAGNLNYQDNTTFGAYLVDNYGMPSGSTTTISNNLLYNCYANSPGATYPQGSMFQFSQSGVDSTRNWYYSTSSAAGFNESTLYLSSSASPLFNAGSGSFLLNPNDYHGVAFNLSTPSIGAVSGTATVTPPTYQTFSRQIGWRQRNINH